MEAQTSSASAASSASSSEWRANELKRRAENRRRAAQSLLTQEPSSSSKASVNASSGSPTSPSSSASSLTLLALESPLSIVIPSSSSSLSPSRLQSQTRSELGQLSTPISSVSLPQLWTTKHEVFNLQMDVIDMQSKQAASIRACDQQFQVEKSVRQLTSDISATQLTIRRKKDELDALQTRLLRLSSTLHDASTDKNFAKNKVRQLEAIRKQRHGLMRCTNCTKEFVPDVFANHVATCLASNSTERFAVVSCIAHSRALPEMKTPRSVNQIMDQAQDIEHHALSITTIEAHEQRKLPCFVSQPPRNLRVDGSGGKSVTHNSILLRWDPPIFTGSTPIIDYEVRFSICHFVKRMKDGESCVSRTFESLPPQTTSRWCLQNPVAANQFWVRDLTADQAYGAFTICAITKNGKSQPSNQVELIATAAAMPPSKPYFLCVGVVTAKTITLTWKEPMDDGGKPIDFYEICFNEAVMEDTILERSSINDKKNNFLDVSEVVYKPRRIRTNSNATAFTLTDLLSGKEHKNFQVRAINQTGIPGDFSDPIASIFTIAPGNEFKLLDELQAAVNSRARVVDSQFLSGFMQRYDRDHYIHLVSRFITSLHPDMEGKVNAILSRTRITISEEESDDEGGGADDDSIGEKLRSNTPKPQFEDLLEEEQIQERRRQFHFRISELKQRLKTADYNVQWCKDRRIDLVALIRAAENRTLEKQAELERAKMFTGPQMDSDVLENGLQRFYTKDLIFALEDEIGIEQLYIVDTKSEIVQVENYLRADERKRDAIQARLQNRKDALEAFEMNPYGNAIDSTHQDVKATSLARLRDGVLFRAFSAFVINRASAIEMRKKVRATLLQFVNYRCRMAFTHWVTVVRKVLRQSSEGNKGGACGVGSIALVNAALGRDDLLLQSRELLQQLRQTDENLKSLVWTKEQQAERQQLFSAKIDADQAHNQPSQRQDKVSPFLLEADAKMDIEDFEGAARLYDFVYSNNTWMNEMPLAMVLDLLLKLGKVNYHMQNYEQALVFLNRATFLAVKLGKRGEEGAVTLCMAHVNFALRSLRLSIENYEHALLCFEATGDKKGQLLCFRGLEQVHGKLEDTEMVQVNKELADEIEFALATKLSNAGQVLDHLRMRLVGAGAESFTEIMLERVGAIVPRLRTQRIMRKLDIHEEAKLVTSLESLLLEKKALLAQGEADLKRALASDTPLVDSSAIIGTNVRYEIEDFKKKLAKLMGSVKAGEDHITKEIANAKIRISNSEDEIKELEAELGVETGNLMRQMMSKDKLRCFRFSATNEALKTVIGTASHGVPTCVATAELTGILFDLLTGACLGQAVGDPHRQHLGPPRGHEAQIVSLYYIGNRIYTGGMDTALGIWEVQDAVIGGFSVTLVTMLQEFDASVVSVVADMQLIVCGCSDCDVFVFDAVTFAIVARMITAHERSVMGIAVDSGNNWFTTAGADNRVKVWELGPRSTQTSYRKITLRYCLEPERRGDEFFNGHLHPITCIKQTSSEIVSGDSNGRIIIWNVDADRKLLRICDVHKGGIPVTCLQFDATRVVSGGQDGTICVTDFATGHLLQTLVGHKESILDLQFDRKRLMSMSSDGKLRLWYWQSRIGVGGDRKKYHILGSGETLKALSLKYHTSINQLLQWNGLPDSSHLYLGQKLIVEIDTSNSAAADELKTLDMAMSTQFGKLSYENLVFMAANKVKRADVETQWGSQKLAMLAKEYFPSLDEDEEGKKEEMTQEDEGESSDSDMALESEEEGRGGDEEAEEENDGKAKQDD